MTKKPFFLLLVFLFAVLVGFAQTTVADSLNNELKQTTNDSLKVEILLNLSKVYFSINPVEAIAYATHALQLSEKIKYQNGRAQAYKNIGIVHYIQANYVEAIQEWQKSLAVFEAMNDKVGIANIESNIGAIYYNQSDNEKALEYYLKSLKASEEATDTYRILTASINIGAVYSDKAHTYPHALEYLQRAFDLAEAFDDDESIGMAAVNLGEVYFKMDQDTLALKYFERSLNAFENTIQIPYSLNYIGKVYLKRNDYKTAMQYHNEAYQISIQWDALIDMAQSLFGIAEVHRMSGAVSKSIQPYTEAESLAITIGVEGAGETLKDIYEGLSLAYSDLSDYNNAFNYQKLLLNIKDKLYTLEIAKKLQGLEFTFDLEKQENKINLLTKDKEIQEQEIALQKFVRNGFVGGFGLMMLFAGVFFTQRNRISKEKKRSDELLLNILPEETAEELKATGSAKTKSFESVSVLFTDFKNFTKASESLSPEELVKEINYCFSEFDKIVSKYGIEKIKTIGDAYMCAGGLPVANTTHAEDVVKAGLEMQEFIEKNKHDRMAKGQPFFELRLGIHTGPVVAGVVGTKKFAYDIWGDTVNTASRMESSGEVGKVNISAFTYELVKDKFKCTHRGKVQAKNKGEIDMYFVEGNV